MPEGKRSSQEELTGLLAQFDVTPEEARAYMLLSGTGNIEASEIARMLSIKRSTVYPILRSLVEKGLVEANTRGVNRYSVLPVEPYLESRIKQANDSMLEMERSREMLVSALVAVNGEHDVGTTKFIEQKSMLAQLIKRLILGAENDLFFFINDRRVRQMSEHYLEATGGINSGNIKIRVLLKVDDENREFVEKFAEHAEIRHTETNPLITFVLRDFREAILIRPTPEIMEFEYFKDYAIWTNDRSLTMTFSSMLERLWEVADIYGGETEGAGMDT